MAIDRNKLRNQILADARDGATKSNSVGGGLGMNPELYQAIALLVAYVDQDYSGIVENERGVYRMKPADDLKN